MLNFDGRESRLDCPIYYYYYIADGGGAGGGGGGGGGTTTQPSGPLVGRQIILYLACTIRTVLLMRVVAEAEESTKNEEKIRPHAVRYIQSNIYIIIIIYYNAFD